MTINVINLPATLLSKVLFGYTRATKSLIPGKKPDFLDVLTGFDYNGPKDEETAKVDAFLIYALANREFLQAKEKEFLALHAKNEVSLQGLNDYFADVYLDSAIDTAIENVENGYEEYKARVLENEKEFIWDEAHSIDIAQSIMYLFENLEGVADSGIVSEEEFAAILSGAQNENFFTRLFEYAVKLEKFDVTNTQTTADEVIEYCKMVEVTTDDLAGFIKNEASF